MYELFILAVLNIKNTLFIIYFLLFTIHCFLLDVIFCNNSSYVVNHNLIINNYCIKVNIKIR